MVKLIVMIESQPAMLVMVSLCEPDDVIILPLGAIYELVETVALIDDDEGDAKETEIVINESQPNTLGIVSK